MTMPRTLIFRSASSLTQAEFARWLDGPEAQPGLRYELVDGFVVQEPPSRWPHGEIAAEVLGRLRAFVRPRRLGRLFDSSQGFALPTGDTVEPDVSFVSNDRWHAARPRRGELLEVVPDLAVEVLSPSTATRDRRTKKRIYARAGVLEYWIADDATRSVTRFVRAGAGFGRATRFGARAELESVVLPGFRTPVGELFPEE